MKKNRYNFFKELEPFTLEELKNRLCLDLEETKKLINKLLSNNILKKISYLSKNEIEDILGKNIEDEENNKYIFKYVGIIILDSITLIIYPKYILNIKNDIEDELPKFKQIMDVISKYNKNRMQTILLTGEDNNESFNIISYALDVIDDYYLNGLYNTSTKIIEVNGNGEILWDKTICDTYPIINKNKKLVYHELYTLRNQLNNQDFYRRLQAAIISKVCIEIKELLEILNVEKINISTEELSNFGDLDHLIYMVEQELRVQYVDKEKKKLENILLYLKRDEYSNSKDNISHYGTRNFNLIWENVCKVVMNDSLEYTLNELNLKVYEGIDANMKLKEIIPKPTWYHYDSNNQYEANMTLIPDLIVVEERGISIYDAKYYKLILNEKGIKGQPGVGDITKQILYDMAYRKLAKENNIKIITNSFLIPKDSEIEENIGYANMGSLFDNKLNNIDIIYKSAHKMYKEYLDI